MATAIPICYVDVLDTQEALNAAYTPGSRFWFMSDGTVLCTFAHNANHDNPTRSAQSKVDHWRASDIVQHALDVQHGGSVSGHADLLRRKVVHVHVARARSQNLR